ncbi:MAG: DUF1579 domain-containing protein [Ignavibacteriaceae bacterium]|nr:DUF1579 domain-containing protein [Ignavibacteriaceae bacterium]
MKKLFALLFVFLFAVSTNILFAQEEGEEMDPAMMKAWQESMTPGPMHEMLASRVGEWKAEVSMWMDPSQPPTTSEATTVCEAMLGGRYFKSIHTGSMMGMPFEGYEISGYDNVKKKFFNVWMDNMGTGIMVSEGTYDEASKTLTLTGQMTEPMGTDMNVREVIKVIDNDHSTFEMYVDMGGKEVKNMEIKYTRIK